MPTVRIGRRGQVTIPRDVRRDLHLSDGDRLLLTVDDGALALRPLGPSILELRGAITVEGPQDFAAVKIEARRARAANRGVSTASDPNDD